jgi:urea transporter
MHAPPAESTALRTLLRSLGQIVLQPNACTGACVLVALLVSDLRLACAALTGAVAANVSAILSGCDEHDTRAGLHGFNGALAGLAAVTFIADNATAIPVAILAATATAWLLGPWSRWLGKRGLGVYSSPCLIVTWAWLPSIRFTASAAQPCANSAWSLAHALDGTLASFAQTTFATGTLPGLFVLAGIAAASRRHAWWAFVGAGIANVAQMLLGAPVSSLQAGTLGFNAALTALAVADCGALVILSAIAASVVLQQIAGYAGWPMMSAPFVAAAWSARWLTRRRWQRSRNDVMTDVTPDEPQAHPTPPATPAR